MKTLDKILTPVNLKFGAPLGRDSWGERPTDKKIYDCKVPMDSEGAYEAKAGVYWGIGSELRVSYTKDLSYVNFYRK